MYISFTYIRFFSSHHDCFWHDIESATLALVCDHRLKQVSALLHVPQEVTGDE